MGRFTEFLDPESAAALDAVASDAHARGRVAPPPQRSPAKAAERPAPQAAVKPKRVTKTLQDWQAEINSWVSQREPAYWKPHEILARLTSEVGELAKEVNHEFGPIRKRSDEKPSSVKEEAGDALFTILALLNSQKLSADEALGLAMKKCYGRDKERFALVKKPDVVAGKST